MGSCIRWGCRLRTRIFSRPTEELYSRSEWAAALPVPTQELLAFDVLVGSERQTAELAEVSQQPPAAVELVAAGLEVLQTTQVPQDYPRRCDVPCLVRTLVAAAAGLWLAEDYAVSDDLSHCVEVHRKRFQARWEHREDRQEAHHCE